MYDCNWAVVVPMANEEQSFDLFTSALSRVLDKLDSGTVYIIIDSVSTDRTLDLSRQLSERDRRFVTV